MSAEIRVIPTQKQCANESAVKILKELLQEAEAGQIETVFVVAFQPGDGYAVSTSTSMNTTLKIGCLERIKASLLS